MNKDRILTYTLSLLVGLLLVILSIVIYKSYFTESPQAKQVIKTVTKYVPTPADTIHDSIPGKVDTAYVIRHYYNKIAYHDTIHVKDVAEISVTDTVSQNSLTGRTVEITYIPPKIILKNSRIALSLLAGKQQMLLLGEYQYKKMKFYGGYDLINSSPVVGIGYQLINW